MNVYIGIDPGINGCISAFYDEERVPVSHMMPTNKRGNIDGLQVIDIIEKISSDRKRDLEEVNVFICIEDVHAIFGSSAGSTFSFGYGLGVVHGAMQSMMMPYSEVQPKAWQKMIWESGDRAMKSSTSGKTKVTDTKATSIAAAQRLFPEADLRKSKRARVPHDGVADSVLIAEYCRRLFRK